MMSLVVLELARSSVLARAIALGLALELLAIALATLRLSPTRAPEPRWTVEVLALAGLVAPLAGAALRWRELVPILASAGASAPAQRVEAFARAIEGELTVAALLLQGATLVAALATVALVAGARRRGAPLLAPLFLGLGAVTLTSSAWVGLEACVAGLGALGPADASERRALLEASVEAASIWLERGAITAGALTALGVARAVFDARLRSRWRLALPLSACAWLAAALLARDAWPYHLEASMPLSSVRADREVTVPDGARTLRSVGPDPVGDAPLVFVSDEEITVDDGDTEPDELDRAFARLPGDALAYLVDVRTPTVTLARLWDAAARSGKPRGTLVLLDTEVQQRPLLGTLRTARTTGLAFTLAEDGAPLLARDAERTLEAMLARRAEGPVRARVERARADVLRSAP